MNNQQRRRKMQGKTMFNPGKFLPNAYLTRTKAGKEVFRINLNVDEILARLEEGKTHMAIDIPTSSGYPRMSSGTNGKGGWKAIQFYAWAMEKKKEAVDVVDTQTVRPTN
jgi:hypothetical protein